MRFSRRSLAASLLAAGLLRPTSLSARQNGADANANSHVHPAAQPLLRFAATGVLDETLDGAWIDADRQVAAFTGRVDPPHATREEIISKSSFAQVPRPLSMLNRLEVYMGFRLTHLSQMASLGYGEHTMDLLTLNIPVARLSRFWETAGYKRRDNDHGSYWTNSEDGTISVSNPVQAAVFARFNNIAILDDHVLAMTSTPDLLADVMAISALDASLQSSELEVVSSGIPADAISAWYVDRDLLTDFRFYEGGGQTLLAESDDAVGPMPAIRSICSGTTAGASFDETLQLDSARAFLVLEAEVAGTTRQIADVINWRVPNMNSEVFDVPFSERLPDMQIDVLNNHLVRVSASGRAASTSTLGKSIITGDIAPFAFMPEE